jgi:hypothetical protein
MSSYPVHRSIPPTLKVQYQHHNYSIDFPGFKPEKERLDQAVGTKLPLFTSCLEEAFSETRGMRRGRGIIAPTPHETSRLEASGPSRPTPKRPG